MAQCPPALPLSELLFIKAPDTICAGSKELVLKTSKVKDNNVKYIWYLPNGKDSIITPDSILTIEKPSAKHSGNYFVATTNGICKSSAIGPFTVNILGAPTFTDTMKKIQLCGINEKEFSSKFKTSATVTGKWFANEGVQIANEKSETSLFKNLTIGENTLIWVVSTKICPSFYKDTFKVTVEAIPRMEADTRTIDARNSSLLIPLGSVNGSNINSIEDLDLKIDTNRVRGKVTLNKTILKYTRKEGFEGEDKFRIVVCNKKCKTLCSAATEFTIKVEYNEQYPNITVPKIFSPQQAGTQGLMIERVEKYPDNEFKILDRWGGVVETIDNYSPSKTWDGTHKGKVLTSGAYYYFFYAKKDNSTPPKENLKPIAGIFYILN
jgi:gliding motility-associated-like protein